MSSPRETGGARGGATFSLPSVPLRAKRGGKLATCPSLKQHRGGSSGPGRGGMRRQDAATAKDGFFWGNVQWWMPHEAQVSCVKEH